MTSFFDLIPNNEYVQGILQAEFTKMTIAFLIAARLHRKWVKKDMKEQFASITGSLDKFSEQMSNSLNAHSKEIKELSTRVQNLEVKNVVP